MDVLSSRILLRPSDLDRSHRFYRYVLGLGIYREFGSPEDPGMVFFLGPGWLESPNPPYSEFSLCDLGQAVARMTVQAQALGLHVRQFRAFDRAGLAADRWVNPRVGDSAGTGGLEPQASHLLTHA